jgi:hypothetical protein
MRSRFAEHSSSVPNRRARVSSRFASITQKMLVRRYDGACEWKNSQAARSRLSTRRKAGSSAGGFDSYEYRFELLSSRAAKAARPAGRIRPAASSSLAFRMFTALQMLFGLRGPNRTLKLSASTLRLTPSIQPKQSASSSASG